MVCIRLFGRLDLRGADGVEIRSVLAQPKRAALLAYLAATPPATFASRQSLLALLWPDLNDSAAHNALDRSVLQLSRLLGNRAIVCPDADHISLARDHVWSDVAAFHWALDHADAITALCLHSHGPLLDGFSVPDAPTFDYWLADKRAELWQSAFDAATALTTPVRESDHSPLAAAEAPRTGIVAFIMLRTEADRGVVIHRIPPRPRELSFERRLPARQMRRRSRAVPICGAPRLTGTLGTALGVLSDVRNRTTPGSAQRGGDVELTPRERDVLRCLVRGMSYKTAARELEVSIDTVRYHIRGVYRKLRLHTAAEAVGRALCSNLI